MNKLLILLVLVFLSGCATPLKEVSATLDACRFANMVPAVDERGVIQTVGGKVTMQTAAGACDAEWAAWNEADERRTALVERRAAERSGRRCPKSTTLLCNGVASKGNCFCTDDSEVRGILREANEAFGRGRGY